ncbi:MAG: TatD family hydrolase [Acidobacteria bacterium]|nr:TatD family hydrolase [Acidobacteriota bacterium]
MVDSHCHLAGPEFAADLDAVIARARTAGLVHAFVILAAENAEELARADGIAARWPDVRFAIGVHPHTARTFARDPAAAAREVDAALAARPLARAVGEIGLDYHYDFSPRDTQQAVFREQIRLAARRRLPIVIHTREAEDDTFRILGEEGAGRVGGVFHCFTGDRRMAQRVLDLGFYVSLAGIVTFPRAQALREVAAMVPLERLLVETDSPYLAPVPHRGTRNEPAHVGRVAEAIAELRGTDGSVVTAAAVENFRRLFNP